MQNECIACDSDEWSENDLFIQLHMAFISKIKGNAKHKGNFDRSGEERKKTNTPMIITIHNTQRVY